MNFAVASVVVPIIPVQNKYLLKLDKYSQHCTQCTGSLDKSILKIRNSNLKNSLQNIKKSEVGFFSCFRNFYNVNPCRRILLFATIKYNGKYSVRFYLNLKLPVKIL